MRERWHGDTTLGGKNMRLPETRWSLVQKLGGVAGTDRQEAFEELCLRYWKPVYRYIRMGWAKSNEDAKDLTQAFFLWLLEGEALRKFDPARGSFRLYLRMTLSSFLSHQQQASRRLKRGGGTRVLCLADEITALEGETPTTTTGDPASIFDREWIGTIVDHALERVRSRLERRGRSVQYRIFAEFDLGGGGSEVTYRELARRHGLGANDVRNYLYSVREAVREEIRVELAHQTAGGADLDEEWAALFGRPTP